MIKREGEWMNHLRFFCLFWTWWISSSFHHISSFRWFKKSCLTSSTTTRTFTSAALKLISSIVVWNSKNLFQSTSFFHLTTQLNENCLFFYRRWAGFQKIFFVQCNGFQPILFRLLIFCSHSNPLHRKRFFKGGGSLNFNHFYLK